jgi:hypothetical protein
MKTALLKLLRKIFGKKKEKTSLSVQYTGQEASDLIYEQLKIDAPCMIARFGSSELSCIINYLNIKEKNIYNYFRFIKGEQIFWEWTNNTKKTMKNNAGFFPADNENLIKFSKLMLDCIPKIDILGSWLPDEIFIQNTLKAKIIRLKDIEPYYHDNPWSRILNGKTVLVIHPFVESIVKQYSQRDKLFLDKNILPEFNLETVKAVQSIAGNDCGYETWFDALESMKNKIMQKKFDIAIIGCGAYGFPLAAFIKEQGKKAVHLGGATQILFGIKGKRWDEHDQISKLYNEYWIRPNKNEIPLNSENVEDGCYW